MIGLSYQTLSIIIYRIISFTPLKIFLFIKNLFPILSSLKTLKYLKIKNFTCIIEKITHIRLLSYCVRFMSLYLMNLLIIIKNQKTEDYTSENLSFILCLLYF